MIVISSTTERHVRESDVRNAARTLSGLALVLAIAACGTDDLLSPRRATTQTGPIGHASVVVTPDYSAFDARADFNGAGVVDHLGGFDEFTGEPVYPQPTPWTTNGVTYTSAFNIVVAAGLGLGIKSNSVSTEFGAQLTGSFDDADAFTLFGADLALIGSKVPVGLVVLTNLGSYAFDNLDVPLALVGQRFFGIALSKPGEHLTGFRFSVGGPNTALLLDNVVVGHVGVANVDPVASSGGPYIGAEGSSVAFALSATDADNDALTFSWNLGDGTVGSGSMPPTNHVYADDGSYEVTLAVDDGRGGVDTVRTTATIANVAPSLSSFTVPTTPLALTGGSVMLPISAGFTDPGTLDTHTATLDCGVGAATLADVPNDVATGACSFSAPGVYSIQLTVRDDDGGSDTVVAGGQVVVYDASAGWVTGGGWIASPVGAITAAPTASGKVTFGFVARYQVGSTTPSGNSEFKLSVGKLNFRSTSLDWLVVGGGNAQLQGRGTVNGAGDYAFAVFAVDGAPDAIRIRVWDRLTGNLVYDNRPAEPLDGDAVTALGGGSIQLHQH